MVIYVELPGSSDACEDAISRRICGFIKLNNIDTTRSSQVHGAIFIMAEVIAAPGSRTANYPNFGSLTTEGIDPSCNMILLQEIGGEVDPTPPRINIYSP